MSDSTPRADDPERPPGERATDPPLSAELADARPTEPPALVLARARVGGALFGAAVGLGRFRVLERLGGGGMGVVYAAYDPELDRGVALKTVHVPGAARELASREARALARLAHPNVVPVYDVGVEGDHVYIVMELVRGETLGRWVRGRPWRDILEVYRQAGQALAAAHTAGLVHRDFKPDNAIVGSDGRVRVIDFGLACEATAAGAAPGIAGTRGYMAPEQAAGEATTPAADQYSFGVALREALHGDGAPPPRWLALVVARATAVDPAARFGSMPALLRALARDPALRRRRAVIAAALAGVVGAAFAVGRTGPSADEPCSGGVRAIDAAWPASARQLALARVATLSPYGGELAPHLAVTLEDHARRWAAGHRAACLVHRRGEQSAALLDRRMACLERGRAALGALAELVAAADARALPDTARAAQTLPDPDACADVAALASEVEPAPPGQAGAIAAIEAGLARAEVQLAGGRADDARGGAERQVATARAVGYAPALADALLVEGHARLVAGDRGAATLRLTEAMTLGLATGRQALAIEAWARRAWLIGTGGQPETGLDGFDVIDALAARAPSAFARALLHNNAGSVELAHGRRDRARALFTQALDEARAVTGPGAIELIGIRMNLAIVTDDVAQRDRLLADAHVQLAGLLGDDHPDALAIQVVRASTAIGSLPRAAALLAPVCRQRERHAWLAAVTATCWVELADLEAELGDRGAAIAALDRAAQLGSDANPNTSEARGYRRLWRGAPDAAVAAFTAELDALVVRSDEPWYRRYARARLWLGLGRALAAQRQPSAAADALERAIAVLAPIASEQRATAIDRRLARARAELALVTAGSPR